MNRLHHESSLYLRQHADNPVHWHPWDEEALTAARKAGLPVLLSIGYSACHWCHVMAHESFEDEATAEVMNRLFINIKVDREERPDLDRTYQLAHQLLTGRGGGWPLTVFLDPEDLIPFFAGTYFPPERRYGMPAFRELLTAISQWFHEHGDERREQGSRLRASLSTLHGSGAEEGTEPDDKTAASVFRHSAQLLRSRFDAVNGGFGQAPRFPQAPLLEAVAVLSHEEDCADLREPLEFTLTRMAESGLRDHLDGGFFRYCVDDSWTIPHFEKMLYDNAMLLPLYAEAAARSNNVVLERAAQGIAGWLDEAMRQPSGGYAASIDADAAGEEGGFHIWTQEEVAGALDGTQLEVFRRAYGLDRSPNFEGRSWHLQRYVPDAALSKEFGMPAAEIEKSLTAARNSLRQRRRAREHPTLDDKQLTSWNALLAGGFVRAGRALNRTDWLDRAEAIFAFIQREMWRDGGLLAVFNRGQARYHAYLDDYAWLLIALLDHLAVRWDRASLEFAIALADAMLERFEDHEHGGFYFNDSAVEAPIIRNLSFQDDATPSGNAIAIRALNRLGRLLGKPLYGEAADRGLRRGMPALQHAPLAHASLIPALKDALDPPPSLVIAGSDPHGVAAMKLWAESRYRLDCYTIGPPDETLPAMLREFRSDRKVAAWLCRGRQCLPPVFSRDELGQLMAEAKD